MTSILDSITEDWAIPALVSSPEIEGAVAMTPPDDGRLYYEIPDPILGERRHPFAFLYWVQGSGEIEGDGILSGGGSPPDSYRVPRLVIEVAFQYRVTGDRDNAEQLGHSFGPVIAQRLYLRKVNKPTGLRQFLPGPVPFTVRVRPDHQIAAVAIQWDCWVKASGMGLAA